MWKLMYMYLDTIAANENLSYNSGVFYEKDGEMVFEFALLDMSQPIGDRISIHKLYRDSV